MLSLWKLYISIWWYC